MRRLDRFVSDMDALLQEHGRDEARILREGAPLLAALVREDDWLPPEYARAPATGYAQYLLHCDARERFCVVSFVWSPGARTPIHDHTVWGMVGVLRGAENCHEYDWPVAGKAMAPKARHRMEIGAIDKVSPTVGDVHVVENALPDRASISIHVYGANIGTVERHVFDPVNGAVRPFVSGYSPIAG
jgi:predicted metal-dependent enzyme (double-stranded beta helix superfamily)